MTHCSQSVKFLCNCLDTIFGSPPRVWHRGHGTVAEGTQILDGDFLSAATGTIVAANGDLLPHSVPAGIPERGVDFGLDAVTKGENIEFSTEILYELSLTDGDVLLQGDGVVLQNKDLINAFEPNVGELGLDALSFYLYRRQQR